MINTMQENALGNVNMLCNIFSHHASFHTHHVANSILHFPTTNSPSTKPSSMNIIACTQAHMYITQNYNIQLLATFGLTIRS